MMSAKIFTNSTHKVAFLYAMAYCNTGISFVCGICIILLHVIKSIESNLCKNILCWNEDPLHMSCYSYWEQLYKNESCKMEVCVAIVYKVCGTI